VQVAQSLVLVTAVRVFFDVDGRAALGLTPGSLIDLLVVGCLLWVLVRIPVWAGRMVFTGRSTVIATARYYLTARVVRAGLGAR
jgi:hypothetical protein